MRKWGKRRGQQGERKDDEQVDIQDLVVAHVCANLVQESDGEELYDRLQLHKLECLE